MGGACTKRPVANDDGESSVPEAAPEPMPEVALEAAPEAAREGAPRTTCEQCGATDDLSVDIHGSFFCAQCWESWHKATAAAYDATAAVYDAAAASGAAAPRAEATAAAAAAGVAPAGARDDSNRTVIAAAVTSHNANVAKAKEAAEKAARAEQGAVARQAAEAARVAAMQGERAREAQAQRERELLAKQAAIDAQKEATARQAAEDAATAAENARRAAETSANTVCAHCGRGLREAPPGCQGAAETYEVVAFASGELCHVLCQEAFRNARVAKCCDVCSKPIEGKFVALKSGVRMHEVCFEAKMGRCDHCGSILTGPVAKVTLPGLGEGAPSQVRVHAACVPLLQAAVQQQQQKQQQDAESLKNAMHTGPAAQALARAEEAAALRKRHRKQ